MCHDGGQGLILNGGGQMLICTDSGQGLILNGGGQVSVDIY